jgi:hypothetical protein
MQSNAQNKYDTIVKMMEKEKELNVHTTSEEKYHERQELRARA